MISAVTTAHINQLASQQNTYLPKATILEALKDRHIVMLVGACCQGKSTVVQTAPSIDPRFGMGGNLTTRPPRTDDERYSYYDHTDSGLQKLFAKIKSHELVQYAVNPTGYIW
jgi:guanylate kinase